METKVTKDEYEITIRRKRTIEYTTESDILLEERHYTDKEFKKVYGKKDILASKEDNVEVYFQIVPATDFNLKIVIGAINGGIPK